VIRVECSKTNWHSISQPVSVCQKKNVTECLKCDSQFCILHSFVNIVSVTLLYSYFNLKPGSHMPPTYLGHSHHYGICEHLSPNHNLSQVLTASLPAKLSWVQLRRQADGCRRWKYFIWTSSAAATYSSKTIRSIFTGEMVENYAVRFAFRANLSTSAIHRKCAGNSQSPLGHRLPNVVSFNRRLRRR